MDEVIPYLNKIKKLVRPVLLPHKEGLLLDVFEKEFKERFGCSVDSTVRHLGINSSVDLMVAIPDVVCVEYLPSGGILLREISDTSTDSVSPWVLNQRCNEEADDDDVKDHVERDPTRVVPSHIKALVMYLLTGQPDGVPLTDFCQAYFNETGHSLEFQAMGFHNVKEFLDEGLGDCVALIPKQSFNGSLDWCVLLKDKLEKTSANVESTLPEDICQNVKQVMMRHPKGLSYHMFRRAYGDTIGSDLDVGQLGFNSLEPFFQHLSNRSIIQLNYENNNIVVKPHDEILKNMSFMEKSTESDRISRPKRRTDVFGPQDKILQQGLPPDLKVGDFLEVIIAEVFNPNRFWIQLKGEVTSKMLEKVMDEMEDVYYSDEADQFKVPDDCVVVGLICASLYGDGNWHRAYIKSMLDLTTVEVFYLDYGTTAKVKKDTLRFLHKRFGHLPGQAIEAKLAGIKPEGGLRRFTKQTSYRFLQLVKMPQDIVGLMAVVKGLSPKLKLWLVDTASNQLPEGIAINQVLVDEGLAEPEVFMDDDPVVNQKRPVVNHLAPLRRPVITSKTDVMGFSTAAAQTLTPPSSTKASMEEIQSKMEMLDSWIKSAKDPGVVENLENLLQTQREEIAKLNKEVKPLVPQQALHIPQPGEFKTALRIPPSQMEHIQPINLTGYKVHVVILDKAAWMTSFEISQFVPNWKGRDILTRMLKLKRMSVESVLVTSESHSELYKAMVKVRLGGAEVEELLMYAVQSLPHILNIFLPKIPTELKEELKKEMERFELTIF